MDLVHGYAMNVMILSTRLEDHQMMDMFIIKIMIGLMHQ